MSDLKTYSNVISNKEIILFLNKLADSLSSPSYGNPDLSAALKKVALSIENKTSVRQAKALVIVDEQFKNMSLEDVKLFINKDQTKSVLISLAKSRFAMGSAKLKKMRLGEIKQQIEGALQHEMSISIISSEAQGSANNRTS
ncbi:MAG: hypothetical protein ACRC9I_06480 [Acinetobacter sp.]|jgi:hypothetical protein|uniref:Uncharacterized protein n=1 Tax=Candidatus Thiocaldithrix dubininis TaxID=3080823 RepID=A0AA95H420_9GAMM|nr:MAG: hypothetical protein QJT80_14040 [Candidatus Thiocaldithrix dubininis]